MTGAVKIGAASITLCGNAATPVRYKQVFHKDLLMSFRGLSDSDFDVDLVKQLAYVMAMQAEGADFKAVSFDAFIEWLEQFEETDLLQAMPEIVGLWMTNTQSLVKAKKK